MAEPSRIGKKIAAAIVGGFVIVVAAIAVAGAFTACTPESWEQPSGVFLHQ